MSVLVPARRRRSPLRWFVPFVAAVTAASGLGFGVGTAPPPVVRAAPAEATPTDRGVASAPAAAGHHTAAGFEFRKTAAQVPCPPPDVTGFVSNYFTRGDCARIDVTVSNTPAPTGTAADPFAVKFNFIAPDGGAPFATQTATRAGTTWQAVFQVPLDASWPAGRIRVQVVVSDTGAAGPFTPAGERGLFLNMLGATIEIEPKAGGGRYAPGEAIPVSGNVHELNDVGGLTQRRGVPAAFGLRVRLPNGTVAGPYAVTADGNGDFTHTVPVGATAAATAGAEENFESTVAIDVIDATYNDAVTGQWRGALAGTGAVLLLSPATTLHIQNSFVSSTGWVKPGDTYPFRVTVKNFTATARNGVAVTIPAPDATRFTRALDISDDPGSVTVAPLSVTWTIGSIAAATADGPTVKTLVVEARAAALSGASTDPHFVDPEAVWKDLSNTATLTYDGYTGPALTATTHGPKIIPPAAEFETARFGDKPFPMVPVDYSDRKHKARHTGVELARVVNSPDHPGSTFNLYQEMSYGQLYPFGSVPSAGIATRSFAGEDHAGRAYDADDFRFSNRDPLKPTCRGATLGDTDPALFGTPVYPERISDGWYQLPGDTEYYGGDFPVFTRTTIGIDSACGDTSKSVYDAAVIADPEIDYNQFDGDKDGVVDFFMLVFVGCGGHGRSQGTSTASRCEDLAPYDNIWPHSSSLEFGYQDQASGLTGYISKDPLTDHEGNDQCWKGTGHAQWADCGSTGTSARKVFVRVGPYNVNPEEAIERASVISHEYGHHLGLPDYYSSYSAYNDWNLMAADYSQHMTIFSKQELGWVVPEFLQPGETETVTDWHEIKEDTGEIRWKKATPACAPATAPASCFYTLSAANGDQNIHNGQAYGLKIDPRITIGAEKVRTQASAPYVWWSGRGNDFGCTPNGGHNLDIVLPELENVAAGTPITLTYKSSWDIEWDFDYAFTMVTTDGASYTSLPSENGYTTPGPVNPNGIACQRQYGNGLTGQSESYDSDPVPTHPADRAENVYHDDNPFLADEYDLSTYAGRRGVVLRFSYFTDPAFDRPGWFIDDLKVTAGEGTSARVIYQTDFTQEDELRIYPGGCNDGRMSAARCTAGWSRVKAGADSPTDHAYYLELRDRSAFDFNGRGQSERGNIGWLPGVLIEYTDEARGYGNNGSPQPPIHHYLDSQPTPGSDCGGTGTPATPKRCQDAAFTAQAGDSHFDDDPDGGADPGDWVDNFTDPSRDDDRWHFDYDCLSLDVLSMQGADEGPENPVRDPNPSNLTANATIQALPKCEPYLYTAGYPGADAPPPPPVAPAVSIGDVTIAEGNSGARDAVFPVRIPQAHSQPIRVQYRTANGTARAPGDYTARSGSVTIPAGQTSTTIRVPVRGDTTDEFNETFVVNIGAESRVADGQGRGTITDDDLPPSLRVNDITVRETDGTSYATFRVSLSAASGKNISVGFATSDGTARAGSDYTARSGRVSIPAGTTFRNVQVAIRGENLRETTENFFLNLSSPSNATIADNRGTATIQDDDPDDPLVLLTKTGPDQARPGSVITYKLTYKNLGPFASANARMVDTLPGNVTFYSASGATYDKAKRTVTWRLGTVPTDATGTRYLRVRVGSTLANGTVVLNRLDFYGDQTFAAPAFERTTVQR